MQSAHRLHAAVQPWPWYGPGPGMQIISENLYNLNILDFMQNTKEKKIVIQM